MKFNYEEHSLKPGIYKILNTHTNRIYIGQAKEFKARWNGHKRSLIAQKHQNKFLLNDFVKCREQLGHDDFLEFHVLEVMEESTKEQRNQREEEWITKWFDNGKNCYNLISKAVSREGIKDRSPEASFQRRSRASEGRKHSDESKQLMSVVQKLTPNLRGTGKTMSEQTKQKLLAAKLGKPLSAEHREKLKRAKSYKMVAVVATCVSTGLEQSFMSIREACLALNLSSGNVSNVLKGRSNQTKGYSFHLMV